MSEACNTWIARELDKLESELERKLQERRNALAADPHVNVYGLDCDIRQLESRIKKIKKVMTKLL